MASVTLSPEERHRLIGLLATRAGFLTPAGRQNFLEDAGLEAFATELDFATDARAFAQQLVRLLQRHGTLRRTEQPALVSLLRELRQIVAGHQEEAAFVDVLLAPYYQDSSLAKPGEQSAPIRSIIPVNRETLSEAVEAFDGGDWKQAIALLTALRDGGLRSNVDVEGMLAEALAESAKEAQQRTAEHEKEARQHAMAEEYALIVRLARGQRTQEQARTAWQRFRKNYHDASDAEGLNVHFATPQQRAVLAVMLDSNRPPPERAEAGRELAALGDPRPGVGLRPDGLPDIAWVELLGGTFPIGGDGMAWKSLPAQKVTLPTFWMAKYPITNAQWQAFLDDPQGYDNPEWWEGLASGKQSREAPCWAYSNHPRENVNWYEVVAFCGWLTSRSGYEVRLPTEQEWERAARGAEGRFFPWGSDYVSGCANVDESGGSYGHYKVGPYHLEQTNAVGIYPQGVTPEGICDLAGNVAEWTTTTYKSRKVDAYGASQCVFRGGSWYNTVQYARASSYLGYYRIHRFNARGFRLVALAPDVL